MVPVIVGAAVAGVAAVALSGDDNKDNPSAQTGRQRVSESTVKKAMARSGRKIQTVTQASIPNFAVFENVQRIIVEQLGVSADEVQSDSEFVRDLGADSLDLVELIMAVEEEFNIEIHDEIAEKIKTVGDAVRYIEELSK